MVINALSVTLTLVIVLAAGYVGLYFVRKFALSIAQENHDAIRAMEAEDEAVMLKKNQAEQAAESAFNNTKAETGLV